MKIFLTAILASLCFFLHSCQKENFNTSPLILNDEAVIKNLKDFYEKYAVPKSELKNTINTFEGNPQWDQSLISSSRDEYFIPMEIDANSQKGRYNVNKYLLISTINKEYTGEYIYVLEKKEQQKKLLYMEQVVLMLKSGKQNNADIIIAKRNLQQTDVAIEKKTGGYISNKNKLFVKPVQAKGNEDTVVVSNLYPPESCTANGGTIVEIEWWYQTYVNGVLVYEEYVYSTFECMGGGGGGGGGTPPSPTDYQLCQLSNAVALATVGATNIMISEHEESISDLTRTRLYSWIYAIGGIGGTLKGIAYDRGVHTRKNTNPSTFWTWKSLVHVSSSVQGIFVGPSGTSLELKVINGEGIIGTYNAKMYLTWRADVKTTKGWIVATDYNTKNSTKTYNIAAPPLIEY